MTVEGRCYEISFSAPLPGSLLLTSNPPQPSTPSLVQGRGKTVDPCNIAITKHVIMEKLLIIHWKSIVAFFKNISSVHWLSVSKMYPYALPEFSHWGNRGWSNAEGGGVGFSARVPIFSNRKWWLMTRECNYSLVDIQPGRPSSTLQKGLNVVNPQPSEDQKINHEPSKMQSHLSIILYFQLKWRLCIAKKRAMLCLIFGWAKFKR